jgi:hypothetical protein
MQNKSLLKFELFAAFLTLFGVGFSGCGKANPDGRENVSGKITLNGNIIDKSYTAAVSFTPLDSRQPFRDGGNGQILGSKYLLTGTDGVKPGKYRVKLFVQRYYDVKTGEPATENTGEFDMVYVSMIPSDFNDSSRLEFEVVKGEKNIFNFDIKTDYRPDSKSIPRAAKKPAVAL